jgi:alpha-tubulin suppressor-like RCC1 family protein
MANVTNATALGTGWNACVVMNGIVDCWGDNYTAELGHMPNTTGDVDCENGYWCNTNVFAIGGTSGTKEVAVGADSVHMCVVKVDGSVWCWGSDGSGELGHASSLDQSGMNPTAIQVPGLSSVHHVTVGDGHSCALKTDGSVYCWGDNTYGQLGVANGDAGTKSSITPVKVPGL